MSAIFPCNCSVCDAMRKRLARDPLLVEGEQTMIAQRSAYETLSQAEFQERWKPTPGGILEPPEELSRTAGPDRRVFYSNSQDDPAEWPEISATFREDFVHAQRELNQIVSEALEQAMDKPRNFSDALVMRCPARWRIRLAEFLCGWGLHTWTEYNETPSMADRTPLPYVGCSRCSQRRRW